MKGENEKNGVGCVRQIQPKSAVGFALKVTHFINNTAAVGGSLSDLMDGCVSRDLLQLSRQTGFGAKQPYQIHLESTRNMRRLPTNGKNKAKFSEFWGSGPTLHAGSSLPFDHHVTADLSKCPCVARGAPGVTLHRAGSISTGPKKESLDREGISDSYYEERVDFWQV